MGRGEIGRSLYSYLRKYGEVKLVSHEEIRPCEFVYLCSGITKTRECEEDPLGSRLVNVENTLEWGKGNKGVWISSERVFDGLVAFRDKLEAICPVTEYGIQKGEAEEGLLSLGWGVIRFSKVIGFHVPLFEGWVDDLHQDKEIRPFSNMAMAPISLSYACEVLRKMRGLEGLYQLSGDRDIKYSDIASFICLYMGKDLSLVKPIEAEVGHPHTTLKSDFDSPDSWEVIYRWCRNRIFP